GSSMEESSSIRSSYVRGESSIGSGSRASSTAGECPKPGSIKTSSAPVLTCPIRRPHLAGYFRHTTDRPIGKAARWGRHATARPHCPAGPPAPRVHRTHREIPIEAYAEEAYFVGESAAPIISPSKLGVKWRVFGLNDRLLIDAGPVATLDAGCGR